MASDIDPANCEARAAKRYEHSEIALGVGPLAAALGIELLTVVLVVGSVLVYVLLGTDRKVH